MPNNAPQQALDTKSAPDQTLKMSLMGRTSAATLRFIGHIEKKAGAAQALKTAEHYFPPDHYLLRAYQKRSHAFANTNLSDYQGQRDKSDITLIALSYFEVKNPLTTRRTILQETAKIRRALYPDRRGYCSMRHS